MSELCQRHYAMKLPAWSKMSIPNSDSVVDKAECENCPATSGFLRVKIHIGTDLGPSIYFSRASKFFADGYPGECFEVHVFTYAILCVADWISIRLGNFLWELRGDD